VLRTQRDVLDALAVIRLQVLLNLTLVVSAFVDRNADLPAWAGHRTALQAGELAFDVEIADLAEVEEPLVKACPFFHPSPMDVVGEVIDDGKAGAARMLIDSWQGHEIDVVDRHSGAVARITIDEIDERVANALDRRNVELHRTRMRFHAPRALLGGLAKSRRGVLDAERHRANRRTM